MNFNWQDTRTVSSADLGGVFFHPPIDIEFDNQPDYEFTKQIVQWDFDQENDELAAQVAARLIISVTDSNGKRHKMGSVENIKAFVDATSPKALRAILKGWLNMVHNERLEAAKDKKKLLEYSALSASIKAARNQVS